MNNYTRPLVTLIFVALCSQLVGCGTTTDTSTGEGSVTQASDSVSGTLVDTTGAPIAGAGIVTLDQAGNSAITDKAGTFTVPVQSGEVELLLQITVQGNSYQVSFPLPSQAVILEFDSTAGEVSVISTGLI